MSKSRQVADPWIGYLNVRNCPTQAKAAWVGHPLSSSPSNTLAVHYRIRFRPLIAAVHHLGEVHGVFRPRHQRGQAEHPIAIAADFGAAEQTGLRLRDLTVSVDLVEKQLRQLLIGLAALAGGCQRIGGVRPDQLLPVPVSYTHLTLPTKR